MTERLYYTDAYLTAFDATVRSAAPRPDGRTGVVLDRTAFYPTSGGQPFDRGRLAGSPVVDVVDDEATGEIVHVVEGAVEAGAAVCGEIDWPRRFNHMQQHTGQHVLSAAFERLFHIRTVSFHLGADAATIDLAREASPREIAAAEDEANRIVWEDRPVAVRFVRAEDAAALPLRKPPARGGTLRLVDIEGFDLSACGGTHVSRTGAIGALGVTGAERFKGGQRLEFVCGGRCLARFRLLRDAVASATRRLSVGAADLAAAIDRLASEAAAGRRAQTALAADLTAYRAQELAADAEPAPFGRFVAAVIKDGADAAILKSLAAALGSRPGFVAVLASPTAPALAVVACAAGTGVRANDIVAALTAQLGGRGGGKPDLAQAGAIPVPGDAIVAAARVLILFR